MPWDGVEAAGQAGGAVGLAANRGARLGLHSGGGPGNVKAVAG